MKYSLSPDRYNLLPISTSEYSTGKSPLLFSIVRNTSHKPNGFTLEAPLKITSSILELLNLLVFCSPNTHLIASTIFVLPQPFGPTIPVIPLLNSIVSFLANDLNPKISNFEIFIFSIQGAN